MGSLTRQNPIRPRSRQALGCPAAYVGTYLCASILPLASALLAREASAREPMETLPAATWASVSAASADQGCNSQIRTLPAHLVDRQVDRHGLTVMAAHQPRIGSRRRGDDAAAVAFQRQRSLDAGAGNRQPHGAGLFLDPVDAAQPDMAQRYGAGESLRVALGRFGEVCLQFPFLEITDLTGGGIGLRQRRRGGADQNGRQQCGSHDRLARATITAIP